MTLRAFSRARAALSLGAFALVSFAPAAHAQFQTLSQDARATVPSPVRLAQGDAYAASPMRETALFGNPAHLSFLGGRLPKVNLAITAGVGGNIRETYDFYDQTLGPAIEEGLDDIRTTNPDRLEDIYNEALRVGSSSKTGQAATELSGTFSVAGVGVGIGVAATSVVRGQLINGGAGIPYVDLYGQGDLLVPVAASYSLTGPALAALAAMPGAPSAVAVGVQGTFVRRWLTTKTGPVDTFDPDAEKMYLFSGSGTMFDVGLQAADLGVPGLDLGLTAHNLFASAIDLEYDQSWAISGSEGTPDDAVEIAATEARFANRGSGAAFRGGVAYRLPLPPTPGIDGARVMLDYTSASTAEFDQSFQAGLRLGAQASFARVLDLRAGVSQGLPSGGVSLKLPGVRLDYVTHGVEDGALLGQRPRRSHMVQLRFGIY